MLSFNSYPTSLKLWSNEITIHVLDASLDTRECDEWKSLAH